jgi:hypothetical protein
MFVAKLYRANYFLFFSIGIVFENRAVMKGGGRRNRMKANHFDVRKLFDSFGQYPLIGCAAIETDKEDSLPVVKPQILVHHVMNLVAHHQGTDNQYQRNGELKDYQRLSKQIFRISPLYASFHDADRRSARQHFGRIKTGKQRGKQYDSKEKKPCKRLR